MSWCKCWKDSDIGDSGNRRIGVKKVNTLLLDETLSNLSGFEFVDSAIGLEFLLEDPFTTYRFASWRKVNENSSVILHYGFDLTVNDFFPEKRFKRVYCFFEGVRITFHEIGKEIFTEGCNSPSFFAPSRLKISCMSRTRRRELEAERV